MTTPSRDVRISKTQRWLDLIAFLVGHHFPVDVEQVMEGVPAYRLKYRLGDETARATVRRMFERDKDELRSAGIPIETVEYTIEHGAEQAIGYRLSEKDFYLPYLRIVGSGALAEPGTRPGSRPAAGALELSTDDARLAMDALRRVRELPASPFARESRTALSKLAFDLGPDVVAEPPVLFADPGEADAVRDVVRALRDALGRRARVRFRYHGIHRGQGTDRDVAPFGLLFQHGHWYLIGHDATRQALRVFRASRMEAGTLEVGPGREYEIDPDFDVSAYARRQAWELGDDEPVVAHVRFEFPLSLWAERNRQGEAIGSAPAEAPDGGPAEAPADAPDDVADDVASRAPDDSPDPAGSHDPGGATVRRFRVRQTEPFLRWIQSFAGDAVIVGPPELRAAQEELARRTLALYEAGVSGEDHDA